MKDPVRVPLTTVTGNGGEVVIREDGTPIAWTPSEEVKAGEHDGYTSIARFDVDEWRTHYKRPLPSSIDILDIGYWPDDESYEPPQEEFRLLADDATVMKDPARPMTEWEIRKAIAPMIAAGICEPRVLAKDAADIAGLKASAYDKWEMSGPEEGDKIDTRVFVTYDGQEIFEITEGSTAKMKSIARRIAKLMNEGKAGLC